MSHKLKDQYKKRFYIISFTILPTLFLIGFFVSIKIGNILSYNIDNRAMLVVAFSFIPLYLLCLLTLHRVLKKRSME